MNHINFHFFLASTTNSPADKSKNKGGKGSKKQVFDSYMTAEDVSHGLKRGELVQVQCNSYISRIFLSHLPVSPFSLLSF